MGTKAVLDVDQPARRGLEQLGYSQAMTRTRGLFHVLFTHGLAAPIATSLVGEGPVVMFWGWIIVSILTQTLALSLAEICSKYPTSAGAYYWCFRLTPPRYKLLFSWINGWLTMVGNWTITLSVTFGTAQLIVAGAGIYHPDWVVTPWQTYVIFLGVTAVACAFCLFLDGYLPTIDIVCACWTALGIIVILISLSATAAAGRRPVSFASGGFDASASGWTPVWSFFIGIDPTAYTYSAIGMIASMAEEVHNSSEILPRAISWSVPIGAITGIVFLLLFTLLGVATLLAVPSGQPIGVMFTLIMGSDAGGFGLVIFGIGMFCAISISCAASRATWAFARDKAIPFHTHFTETNPYLSDVPVNALLLSTAIQVLLGLIYLGSSTAFNAFVWVAVITEIANAPFHLGKLGSVVNAIAVLWIMFAIVLFSMPAIIPVTQVTMNYASVVFVGFAAISAVWYMISPWRFLF
ncbi:amino acid transporter [Gyrodon lividus]|nr:amino acid transporter [Gyrodon lividus]